ncbi:Zinc finger C2H2-type, partial [Trinorchestia longiramus]
RSFSVSAEYANRSGIAPYSSLNLSELVTDKRTYLCPLCPKEIVDVSSFKKHYTGHSGEKEFSCPACSYRTNQVSNLYRHSRTRHGFELDRTRRPYWAADAPGM